MRIVLRAFLDITAEPIALCTRIAEIVFVLRR